MPTRDQRALFYEPVGTLWEIIVFGFKGKYGCKAEPFVKNIFNNQERKLEACGETTISAKTPWNTYIFC